MFWIWPTVLLLLFPLHPMAQEEDAEKGARQEAPGPQQTPTIAPSPPGLSEIWRRLQGRSDYTADIDQVIRSLFTPRLEPRVPLTPSEIASQYSDFVVGIRAYDEAKRPKQRGSGIIIGHTKAALFILTNHHIVDGASSLEVIVESEASFPVWTIVGLSPKVDLALLHATATEEVDLGRVYGGSVKDLVPGDRVTAIGNPLGLQRTVSEGLVSAIRKFKDIVIIQTTAPISAGSSGGPLFNAFGELIGLTTATIPEGQNLNLAVAIDHLLDLLDSEPIHLRKTGDTDAWSGPSRQRTLGLFVLLPWLIMGLVFGVFLKALAKRKGRSQWLWFAAGFVPTWNVFGAIWLASLTDLAVRRQIDALRKTLGDTWMCSCENVNPVEAFSCAKCGVSR